ncbi:uncharacterized protein LOC116286503 isoform X2 [Actinia tenebrosa]|uniref:Uncharacterized protein LOC116286503 isoform X2 n=1 Tax=Actinia tenebrosa TaxID=6105 RepID=A0A6P8GZF4_ACTTE|nr:uncharacterized protein LOC116286503 isoform X2 [Actinia tenebrosa]
MKDESDRQTKIALTKVIQESLRNPEKKNEFVREGTIDLLSELCRSKKSREIKAFALATMGVLCHGNQPAKDMIMNIGGLRTILSLCSTVEDGSNTDINTREKESRLLSHEQSAALLQKLTYKDEICQADLVTAGAIRRLIQLCDVFNPTGSHSNCCHVPSQYSDKANKLFTDLTVNKKLIGKVHELSKEESTKVIQNLIQSEAEIDCLREELNKIYNIDLYDTITEKDIHISNELITRGMAWPDLNSTSILPSEERNSPQKETKGIVWSDIRLSQVIDAGHFWAHIGGDSIGKSITAIDTFLRSQELAPYPDMPQPGDMVCVLETMASQKTTYRARVLDVSSSDEGLKAKVFAVDFGFTNVVPGMSLFILPRDPDSLPPQVSLCTLSGVQAKPKHAAILEYAAGALRNLSESNEDYISYIFMSSGIEALLKLCSIPNKKILIQVLGALMNISLDFRYRARIGYLGGVKILMDICLQYEEEDDVLLLALGTLQNIMVATVINRSRTADCHGLTIFVHLYLKTTNEEVKNRALRALKNLVGGSSSDSPERKNVLDLTAVMDECPTTQKRFSLSVTGDSEEHCKLSPRRLRTRKKRNRGMIEAKPTHISLSMDCIKKASSELSETDTSSDDDYAGRWTSETDGDTDGESLIKDLSTYTPSYSTLESPGTECENYYVQTHHMPFGEDETHEFSSQTNVHNISKRKIMKSLCAFLNNKKCGTIYIGVRGNGEISGVKVKRKELYSTHHCSPN